MEHGPLLSMGGPKPVVTSVIWWSEAHVGSAQVSSTELELPVKTKSEVLPSLWFGHITF